MHSDHAKGVHLALRQRNQLHVYLLASVKFQPEHAGICRECSNTWTQKMTDCVNPTLQEHMIEDRMNG